MDIKSILCALCVLCLLCVLCASCKEEKYNTGQATVQMGQTTYTVKESKGIFTVPIVVTGEQNGPIRVEVAVVPAGGTAVEDQHFYITGKTLNIPAGKQRADVEIRAVDDRIINADRTFTLQIVHADGAAVSATQSACAVTLRDNDNIPYERLQGVWTVQALDAGPDGMLRASWTTEVTPYDETDAHYGKQLAMKGWMAFGEEYPFITMPLNFSYDDETGQMSVGIALGETVADSLNFSGGQDDPDALCHVVTAGSGMGYITRGSIVGHVNPQGDTIVFDAGMPLVGIVYNAGGTAISVWIEQDSIVMTLNP